MLSCTCRENLRRTKSGGLMAKAKAKVKRAKSLTNVKSWGKRRDDEVRWIPLRQCKQRTTLVGSVSCGTTVAILSRQVCIFALTWSGCPSGMKQAISDFHTSTLKLS